MRVVSISDTHGINQPKDLPDGDVLIHAGDLSMTGAPHEIAHALAWLRRFPHKHKLFIGGNHDNALAEFGVTFFEEQMRAYKDLTPLTYLCGSITKIEGLRVFGSSALPHNDIFRIGARAYMLDGLSHRHWGLAPDCDILITHGPPKGVLDGTFGDPCLTAYVEAIKPKLHVFGHVHLAHGWCTSKHTIFVNAAMVDDAYRPVNEPIVVDI